MNKSAQLKQKRSGFTLTELMVVLTIISILALVAYPSYLEQVRKSRRAVAKNVLLDISNRQEQYFFGKRSYADTITQLPGYSTYTPGCGTVPCILFDKTNTPTIVPADAVYAVSVEARDDNPVSCGGAPCFKLKAEPQNDQTNDSCGTFTLRSDGKKEPDPATSNCW